MPVLHQRAQHIRKLAYPIILLGCLLFMPAAPILAQTENTLVGINLGHAQTSSIEQQTALLNDLKAAGIHVIRTGIGADDKGLDFVKHVSGELLYGRRFYRESRCERELRLTPLTRCSGTHKLAVKSEAIGDRKCLRRNTE